MHELAFRPPNEMPPYSEAKPLPSEKRPLHMLREVVGGERRVQGKGHYLYAGPVYLSLG